MSSKLQVWEATREREGQSYSAADLRDALERFDTSQTRLLLETRMSEVAIGEFAWIAELSKLGYSPGEICKDLLEKSLHGPWIFGEFSPLTLQPFKNTFHLDECVHEGTIIRRKEDKPSGNKFLTNKPSIRSDQVKSDYSKEFIRESIEYFCGFGGKRPAANGSKEADLEGISFEDNATTAFIKFASVGPAEDHKGRILLLRQMVESLKNAAGILQHAGRCCDSFTFLEICDSRVHLLQINLSILDCLDEELSRLDCLGEEYFGGGYRWTYSFRRIERLWWELSPELGKLMLVDDRKSDATYAWGQIVQFISLAMLSYAQTHVGPLRPFFLDTPQERVVLSSFCNSSETAANCPCIVGSLVELTCMGDMTGQSVFAFQYQHRYDKAAVRETSTRKYDLVASPENLLDTWGPGEFITDAKDDRKLYGISVGGGSITAVENEGETTLHWSWEPISSKSLTKVFDRRLAITIGATVLENVRCQADTKKQISDAVALLEELGTFPSYWEVRERQLGLGIQGGQVATAAIQFNQTWVKMRGLTKKSALLVQRAVYTAELDSLFGVQVSVCTGIARRVRLRDLLADVLPAYVRGLVTTPRLWKSLNEDLEIIEALRRDDFKAWLMKLDHEHQQAFESLVLAILFLLQDTGVDRQGQNFVIACIQPDLPFQCFKVPCRKESYWARILTDSEDIATFAYITTQCFETSQVACRGPGAAWANTTGLLMTAVSCYQERVATLGTSSSSMQWTLKHSEAYLIGKPDASLLVEVDRPDNKEAPRLLVSSSTIPPEILYRLYRKGRLGKPRRLREKKTLDQLAESVVVLMS